MGFIIFAALVGIPILEIAVFISVGERIGLGPTLVTVVLTAIVGTILLRRQGFATLFRVQEQLNAGELPLREVFNGLCLLFAGALLLTPGFVTDGIGFLLFVPPVRSLLMQAAAAFIAARGAIHVQAGVGGGPSSPPFADGFDAPDGGPVIDGEFREVPPGSDEPSKKSDADEIVRRLD